MNSHLRDVRRCLERAAEARGLANEMTNPETKQFMLSIAESYERLAELAEDQFTVEAKRKKPKL